MKKLSKEQVEQLANLTAEVRVAEQDMHEARDEVNRLIRERLNAKIDEYNEVMVKVASFVEEIMSEMESFSEEQSEKWSESEAGSYYEDWKDEWAGIDTDALDHREDIDLGSDLADQLAEVSTEPNR